MNLAAEISAPLIQWVLSHLATFCFGGSCVLVFHGELFGPTRK
jgi:hypothetical protein